MERELVLDRIRPRNVTWHPGFVDLSVKNVDFVAISTGKVAFHW